MLNYPGNFVNGLVTCYEQREGGVRYSVLVKELSNCEHIIEGASIDYGYKDIDELRPLFTWRDQVLLDLKAYRR